MADAVDSKSAEHMKNVGAPFLPYRLQFLQAIGSILLVLGILSAYSGMDIVPVALRFRGYGSVLIVVGVLLVLPALIHIWRNVRDAWRRQKALTLPVGPSLAERICEESQEGRQTIAPSFVQSVRNDCQLVAPPLITFLIIGSFPFVMLALGLTFGHVPGRARWRPVDQGEILVWGAIWAGVSCLALVLHLYRWRGIRRIFRKGIGVSGKIVSNDVFSKIASIEILQMDFEYECRGLRYKTIGCFFRSPLTDSLAKGQAIAVLVDPDRPSKALIKTIYSGAASSQCGVLG